MSRDLKNGPLLRHGGEVARACAVMLGMAVAGSAWSAATITIVNGDPAGVGFNDTTVVAPVGGNAGTTLGAQRLNAFQAAADKWGATLTSASTIRVLATWEALTCTATSAVLGSAGATSVFRDFPSAPLANTWYGKAQTGKLEGSDPDIATADIRARFNVNLGAANCLAGSPFYLGLDANHGTSVDLVTVLEHEFAHGLGFQTYTSGSSGAQLGGLPSVWDHFLLDTSTNKLWKAMTDAERVTSALNYGSLVWSGSAVNTAAASLLNLGVPSMSVTLPASVAGSYAVGSASFGPALQSPGLTGEIMQVVDTAPNTGLACTALSAANALAVNGKIALVDRGTCGFTVKAANVQAAGAVAMIVVDNVVQLPPPDMGGADASITIPSVRISLAAGNSLKTALAKRSRTRSGVYANLSVNMSQRRGADLAGRMLMYAPNPFQGGSSVSHFDISAFPNLLMEPAINSDLTHEVTTPQDLSFKLLQDIGW